MDEETVELGVALLERLEHHELSLAETMDRIETITEDPLLVREILDRAELRGVIHREDGVVQVKSREYVAFQSEVVTKEGDFSCRRCGTGISTGYFICLDEGEVGPFGSSCIRKVTGRE